MKIFTKLVLSGGGPKGFLQLGALQYLYEHHYLQDINEYWGTSIGSVISFFLSIGMSPVDIFYELLNADKIIENYDTDYTKLLNGIGLCPIEQFGNKIRNVAYKTIGFSPTFQQLKDNFQADLHITGTNIDQMKGQIFDHESHPEMEIVEAIEISCCLPFIFTKKIYKNETYADGGFYNNFPIELADNSDGYVLGICNNEIKKNKKIDGVFDWLVRLFLMPVHELHFTKIKYHTNSSFIIHLEDKSISGFEMNLPNKQKIKVFINGYRQAKQIIEQSPFIKQFQEWVNFI